MDHPGPRRRAARSDGQRNRRLILEAAARAFATHGTEASLNAIAREAGVGIATLFRHFPTRDTLVEAIYSDSLDALCAAAPTLAAEQDAATALRAWMTKFLDYVSLKSGLADTLRALTDADVDSRVDTLGRLTAAVRTLLDAGHATGVCRPSVRADDVLAALSGTALIAGRPAQRDQADRLVDLLLAGIITDHPA